MRRARVFWGVVVVGAALEGAARFGVVLCWEGLLVVVAVARGAGALGRRAGLFAWTAFACAAESVVGGALVVCAVVGRRLTLRTSRMKPRRPAPIDRILKKPLDRP